MTDPKPRTLAFWFQVTYVAGNIPVDPAIGPRDSFEPYLPPNLPDYYYKLSQVNQCMVLLELAPHKGYSIEKYLKKAEKCIKKRYGKVLKIERLDPLKPITN